MGPEFERYLPAVMLLAIAGAKADPSLYRAFINPLYQVLFTYSPSDEEDLDGQTYGVCTSIMDEKC